LALFRTADRLGAGRFPAYMPEDQSDRILAQKQERFTENTLVGPKELTKHLREVHAEGYARTL
jgi:DNA-binding IclR family transcriptional regulator